MSRGSHKLGREGVARSQRRRIHEGLVEAVAYRGYRDTDIEHIASYACLSPKAFYEFYKCKEDCFLATFDLIAMRIVMLIVGACKRVEDAETQWWLAIRVLLDELEAHPKSLRLLLVDSLTAGPSATRRLCRLLSAVEKCFPGSAAPWVVGGLYRVLFTRLRTNRRESALHGYMVDWAEMVAVEANHPHIDQPQAAPWPRMPQLPLTAASNCALLEESAINLVLSGQPLSMRSIAAHAGVSRYRGVFQDADECIAAALDTQDQQLLETIAADSALLSEEEWPTAVYHAISRATAYLATHPAYTAMLATKSYEIGFAERSLLLGDEIVTLLTEGAPNHQPELVTELISGALARKLTAEVAAGYGHRLQSLDTAAASIVLALYTGL